ncbi:MAG: serine/threonine-protein kinase [Planctomycetaceae bacterium]|nr:serine/threonine protein kinase [Planctomycetaceae bacterium]
MTDNEASRSPLDATVAASAEGTPVSSPETAQQQTARKPDAPEQKKSQQLGDFKIVKKLGQGGMGAVYLAHQVSLDRPCALKVMSPEIAKKQDFVQRFIREARVMAKIEHPSVVRCYAVGEFKGTYYVAMEFIDGCSMQNWIDTLKTLSVGDALHVTIVCAQALAHAHKMNLIHRDIKPDNILVTKNGAVKVADLGLAKAVDEDNSMTQSGTGMGTPLYMPPEQARNAKYVDLRSDIYALGCTLYKFLTGAPPFTGDSAMELILNKEKGKFTPAARLNKDVPEKLDLMIDKMIAKDPQHRYQSCDELLTDLLALGLENPSLGFIDSNEKVVLGTATTSVVATGNATRVSGHEKTISLPKSSREEAEQQKREKAQESKDVWFVKFTDRAGSQQVKRMTTDQVHRGLATRMLNELSQVTKNQNAPMVSIGSVPAFKKQVEEILMEKAQGKRKQDMQALYNKLDKQHGRRKWWRLLENIKDGTFGWISLMIWLAIVGAIGYGLYLGVPFAWKMIAENFGLV